MFLTTHSSNHAIGPGVAGSLSNRLVGPSSFFNGGVEHIHVLLKTFRRIWLEPQRPLRFWLVPIVPVFIDLRVLFAKLHSLSLSPAYHERGAGLASMITYESET
jgi:hypothetical protein